MSNKGYEGKWATIFGDLMLGTGSATTTITGGTKGIGISSSTPFAVLAIENINSDRSFIVSDQAADPSPFVIEADGDVMVGDIAGSNPAGDAPSMTFSTTNTASNPSFTFQMRSDSIADEGYTSAMRFYVGATAPKQSAAITSQAEGTAENAGKLAFWTMPVAGSITERMRIDNTGYIGIGSTTPGALIAASSVASTTAFFTTSVAGTGSCVILKAPNGVFWGVYVSNAGTLTTVSGGCL
jgi:hypothetical protein